MSNRFCSVFGCNSLQRRNREISFHVFPKKNKSKVNFQMRSGKWEYIDQQLAWVIRLKIGKTVTKNMRVCSKHFQPTDYFVQKSKGIGSLHRLKKNSVPSLNLPTIRQGLNADATTSSTTLESNLKRTKRAENRSAAKENNCQAVCDHSQNEESESQACYTEEEMEAVDALLTLITVDSDKEPKRSRDFEVQVNTYSAANICSLITTDSNLNSMTGLDSFKMLETIELVVKLIHKDKRVLKLSIRERIILTLLKLKCNLSYRVLAILFGLSAQLCATYINAMLTILSKALKPTVRFVSMEEIRKNLPKCFLNFQNVRTIVDCTEVTIQKPKCLCCRIRFYSQYKGNTTVKVMIGVSPAGIITFLSDVYGGRASDKSIFEQSDLITHFSRGEAIMVDKGFLIDDLCSTFGVQLIRPPFLRSKKQLSPEEAIVNSNIARARVNVERVNQRLKIFKILSGPVPFNLVHKMDEVFTIICGIANLSAPVLSNTRF